MSIVDIPEKSLFNVEGKYDMIKVRTSWVNSSLTLFLCSVRAIYNRVNYAKTNVSC